MTTAARATATRGIRLAVVAAYPPSRASISEYAGHLVGALSVKPEIESIVVLADRVASGDADTEPGHPNVAIDRCWTFESRLTPLHLCRAIRRHRPDAVLFSVHFTTFGQRRLPAALGLLTSTLLRLQGMPVVILLHNLVDAVDLDRLGPPAASIAGRSIRLGGRAVTRLMLTANLVCVTLPRFAEILRDRYGAENVALVPHGSWDLSAVLPETRSGADSTDVAPSDPFRLLAFGRFGTYKKLELVFEALAELRRGGVNGIELVVAGIDHPNAVGYLESIRRRYEGTPGFTLRGYVSELDVPDLFARADAVVFPYIATTGTSGVMHQAGAAGRPMILPRIADLGETLEAEGFAGEYFTAGSAPDLAAAILRLRDDPRRARELGLRNHLAATAIPIDEVADWYVIHLQRCLGLQARLSAVA